MKLSKEIIDKLISAHNAEQEEDPKIVVKIANVAGPGEFYAAEGYTDDETGKFMIFGWTNMDFCTGEIFDDFELAIVYLEDFDTFNIPYGHVIFDVVDSKCSYRKSEIFKEK